MYFVITSYRKGKKILPTYFLRFSHKSIAHSPSLSTKSKITRILVGYRRPGSDIVVANSVEFEVVFNIP
mgnify:CR=1 FL=1